MGLTDQKPLKYSEIAQGNFDSMMQQEFLKGHRIASEYGQKVTVSANIDIYPPDPRVPNNGNVSFSVHLKEPKYVSQKFTTALVGGLPINDGKTVAEAEQYNMFEKPAVVTEEPSKPEIVQDEVRNNGKPRIADPSEQDTHS